MSDDDHKPRVFQLGTVPPPPGDNDAYNAPTKVGPMVAQIQELINAAAEEAERKNREQPTTTAPPPLAATTAPPPLATTTAPPPSMPNDGRLPSIVPDDEDVDGAFEDETRIAEGAYAMLADLQPTARVGKPATAPPTAASMPPAAPPVPSVPPPVPSVPPPVPSAQAAVAALPIGPAPIVITEPLPVFDIEESAPLALESDPATYSDPIAHTRPEWSSVSKSEPRLPAAAPVTNRMPLLIGLLVVVFGIAGIAFLIFGHR